MKHANTWAKAMPNSNPYAQFGPPAPEGNPYSQFGTPAPVATNETARQAQPSQAERSAVGEGQYERNVGRSVIPMGALIEPLASALTDPETRNVIGHNVRGAIDAVARETPRLDVGRLARDTASSAGQAVQGFARDPLGSTGRFLGALPGALWQGSVGAHLDAEQNAQEEDAARARGDTAGVANAAEHRAGSAGRATANTAGMLLTPLAGANAVRQGALASALTLPQATSEGQGSLQERLPGALVQSGEAGIGAGVASRALPPVVRGASRVLGPIVRPVVSAGSEAAQRLVQNFGADHAAELSPEQAARGRRTGAQTVANMAHRIDPTGARLTANDVEGRGKPITAAEALGREAETALKVAGRRSGTTPDALEAQMSERAIGTPARLVDDFAHITGLHPEEIEGNFAALTDRLRASARPLYDRAYGFNGPVTSNELSDLARTPAVRSAMRNAVEIAGNERIRPEDVGMSIGPSGEVEVRNPTMRTWDLVKRGLDQELEQFRDSTTRRLDTSSPRARSILGVLGQLRDALTDSRQPWGPAYQAALDAGGEPVRLEQSFRDAGKLMNNVTTMRDFESRFGSMPTAQQEAFRAGIVNDIRTRAMSGRTRLNDLLTRSYEQKIMRVFGAEPGRQLIQRIQDERFLLTHGRRMQPGIGSDTSETLLGDSEQQEQLRSAGHFVGRLADGKVIPALVHLLGDPLVGIIRGAQMPLDRASRDMMGQLLMMPPSELASTLKEYARTRQIEMNDAQIIATANRIRTQLTAAVGATAGRNAPPPYRSRALNQALATGP